MTVYYQAIIDELSKDKTEAERLKVRNSILGELNTILGGKGDRHKYFDENFRKQLVADLEASKWGANQATLTRKGAANAQTTVPQEWEGYVKSVVEGARNTRLHSPAETISLARSTKPTATKTPSPSVTTGSTKSTHEPKPNIPVPPSGSTTRRQAVFGTSGASAKQTTAQASKETPAAGRGQTNSPAVTSSKMQPPPPPLTPVGVQPSETMPTAPKEEIPHAGAFKTAPTGIPPVEDPVEKAFKALPENHPSPPFPDGSEEVVDGYEKNPFAETSSFYVKKPESAKTAASAKKSDISNAHFVIEPKKKAGKPVVFHETPKPPSSNAPQAQSQQKSNIPAALTPEAVVASTTAENVPPAVFTATAPVKQQVILSAAKPLEEPTPMPTSPPTEIDLLQKKAKRELPDVPTNFKEPKTSNVGKLPKKKPTKDTGSKLSRFKASLGSEIMLYNQANKNLKKDEIKVLARLRGLLDTDISANEIDSKLNQLVSAKIAKKDPIKTLVSNILAEWKELNLMVVPVLSTSSLVAPRAIQVASNPQPSVAQQQSPSLPPPLVPKSTSPAPVSRAASAPKVDKQQFLVNLEAELARYKATLDDQKKKAIYSLKINSKVPIREKQLEKVQEALKVCKGDKNYAGLLTILGEVSLSVASTRGNAGKDKSELQKIVEKNWQAASDIVKAEILSKMESLNPGGKVLSVNDGLKAGLEVERNALITKLDNYKPAAPKKKGSFFFSKALEINPDILQIRALLESDYATACTEASRMPADTHVTWKTTPTGEYAFYKMQPILKRLKEVQGDQSLRELVETISKELDPNGPKTLLQSSPKK